MLGAGTIINPIIKIVTTVAVLAAVYFFIVAPILDTTNEAFDDFSDSFGGFETLPTDIQSQLDDAFDASSDTDGLEACIERAMGRGGGVDQDRIDRCLERFG